MTSSENWRSRTMTGEHTFDSMPEKGPRPPAVRPRDAATLIVVRRDGTKARLLMGRRHGGHDFMPGKWVFPGGRIDPSDYRAPHLGELKPETERRLRQGLPARRATALALTAIRETFEETGLLIGRPAITTPRAGPWREFLAQGVLPDISCLDMIARAVTPPQLPKRFDARFLVAPAEALVSLERRPDCGELDEIAWVEVDEALGLELPGVTRFVVRDVAERLDKPERPANFMRIVGRKPRLTPI
jgi:8-oxo-dGTP pyrophosphatase MutT (NUDIX family)